MMLIHNAYMFIYISYILITSLYSVIFIGIPRGPADQRLNRRCAGFCDVPQAARHHKNYLGDGSADREPLILARDCFRLRSSAFCWQRSKMAKVVGGAKVQARRCTMSWFGSQGLRISAGFRVAGWRATRFA